MPKLRKSNQKCSISPSLKTSDDSLLFTKENVIGGEGDVPRLKSALSSVTGKGERSSKHVRFSNYLETRTGNDGDSTESEDDGRISFDIGEDYEYYYPRSDISKQSNSQTKACQREEQDSEDDWETEYETEYKVQTSLLDTKVAYLIEVCKTEQDPVDLFNPMCFRYVDFKTKVIDDYVLRYNLSRQKSIKLRKGKGSRKEHFEVGADLDIEPPEVILPVDKDILGIQNIKDILDSPDLTISQKYQSLGIDDNELQDEIPEEGNGLCEWLAYKFDRFYYSQWPSIGNS